MTFTVETLTVANFFERHADLVELALEHGERHIRQVCLDWLRALSPPTLVEDAIMYARVDGVPEPVGLTVGVEPAPRMEGPNFTVVHQDYRRRGIACALMRAKIARLSAYETLVAPDNAASIRLMERVGLVRVGLVDNGFGKQVLRYRHP